MSSVGQPVTVLRRAGATGDTIEDLSVAGTKPTRLLSSQNTAERAVILGDSWNSLRRGDVLWLSLAAGLAGPFTGRFEPWLMLRVASQNGPVEAHVRMRMLEGLSCFFVERQTTQFDVRWRPEEIQDARPLRPHGRAVGVHDAGGFVTALVARVPDKWHGVLICRARRRLSSWPVPPSLRKAWPPSCGSVPSCREWRPSWERV